MGEVQGLPPHAQPPLSVVSLNESPRLCGFSRPCDGSQPCGQRPSAGSGLLVGLLRSAEAAGDCTRKLPLNVGRTLSLGGRIEVPVFFLAVTQVLED